MHSHSCQVRVPVWGFYSCFFMFCDCLVVVFGSLHHGLETFTYLRVCSNVSEFRPVQHGCNFTGAREASHSKSSIRHVIKQNQP